MVAYLLGVGSSWIGLVAWIWITEYESERYWIESIWSLPRLEYFDVPWLATLLIVLPLATAWACVEALDAWRHVRIFDRRIGGLWIRRAALGMILGVVSVALFGVGTAFQSETHWPDVVNVLWCVALPTAAVMPFMPRLAPGRCRVCDYDTEHLPFPSVPGFRRCPECGSQCA